MLWHLSCGSRSTSRDHNSPNSSGMALYLRKVTHPKAHEIYRVILKLDGDEVEIRSIGIQHGAAWARGIDTVIPMREGPQGLHAAVQGRLGSLWADEANLTEIPEREAAAACRAPCRSLSCPRRTRCPQELPKAEWSWCDASYIFAARVHAPWVLSRISRARLLPWNQGISAMELIFASVRGCSRRCKRPW